MLTNATIITNRPITEQQAATQDNNCTQRAWARDVGLKALLSL